jgi:hypothetical protein
MTLRPLATPVPPASRGGDVPFSSPLLGEVAARFDSTTRHVILELGPISVSTLALLQGKRCRLLVADATRALSALDEQSLEPDLLSQEVKRLIVDAGTEKIDTVLCWDLLNYLSLPLMSVLFARLAAIMRPGGIVHAYIHSAQANMSKYPPRYALTEENLVLRLDHGPVERKAPRYSYGDLEKHAAGLRVDRSMLLRNGIQEFLLRARPD